MTFGEKLKAARLAKGMSLRDVEKVAEISNGYLSLLEMNEVKQPSPHHLYKLANLYEIDYPELMRLVGYEMPAATAASAGFRVVRGGLQGVAFSAEGLTSEQRAQVESYIGYLRSQGQQQAKRRRK